MERVSWIMQVEPKWNLKGPYRQEARRSKKEVGDNQSNILDRWEERGPQAKECKWPQEDRKGKEKDFSPWY